MKANFSFILPDEQQEFDMMMSAGGYHAALWEMDQWLRSKLKHEQLTDEQDKAYQECRDKLREFLNDNNVTIS